MQREKRNVSDPFGSGVIKKSMVGILAVLILAYGVTVGYASFAKEPDQRAVTMLNHLRYQLAQLGVEKPEENIGLDFGQFAGCRVWLLEHLIASGCMGLRIEESIRSRAGPEKIRDLAQKLCQAGNCTYNKSFVLSVRYLRIARTYETDNSVTVVREQSGNLTRYWLEGRSK